MPMTDRPPPPRHRRDAPRVGIRQPSADRHRLCLLYCFRRPPSRFREFAGSTNPDDIPVHLGLIAALSVISFVVGAGLLIAKVLVDRVLNREDNYYSKNIER